MNRAAVNIICMSFGDSMYAFLLSIYMGRELLGHGGCVYPAIVGTMLMLDQDLQRAEAKMGSGVQEIHW